MSVSSRWHGAEAMHPPSNLAPLWARCGDQSRRAYNVSGHDERELHHGRSQAPTPTPRSESIDSEWWIKPGAARFEGVLALR
jgi:hypothetical protein